MLIHVWRTLRTALADETGLWRIPAAVLKGVSVAVIPLEDSDASYLALTAAGVGQTYTTKTFTAAFAPIFDIFCAMDQVGSIQPQARDSALRAWRNIDNPIVVPAMGPTALRLTAYRLPNFQIQFILTNTSGVNCGFTEFVVIDRSL